MVADLGNFFCGGQRIESPEHTGLGPVLSGTVPLCQLPHRTPQRVAGAVHGAVIPLLMHSIQGQGKVDRPLCRRGSTAALKAFRHSQQKASPQLRQLTGCVADTPPQLCQFCPPLVVRQSLKPVQLLRRIQFDVLCFHTIPPLWFCFGIDFPKPCAEMIIGLWRGIQNGALGLFILIHHNAASL